jgi:hypothetical protein
MRELQIAKHKPEAGFDRLSLPGAEPMTVLK